VPSIVPETPDEQQFLLATLPPSKRQIRLALGIGAALLVAFGVTVPFTYVPLPRVDAFIPTLATAIFINDVITSALLFAQFFVVRRLALLVLANVYLFTGFIVIPYALTFPGLFAPTGLLGAGLQSTVWLYVFWHVGSPLAVIAYGLFKEVNGGTNTPQRSPAAVIAKSVAAMIALVCGLTWLATAGEKVLPSIFFDSVRLNQHISSLLGGLIIFLIGIALALLWLRRRSVLDLWLMVMCGTWLLEAIVSAVLIDARFSLGWYAGRIYGLISTIFVMVVLLSETTTLYANLARSVMKQRREREARQIAMEAMAASIAHEVNQPLAAIALNSQAAMAFLAKTPLNIDEVRVAVEDIASDSVRASEVISSLRAMFKKEVHGRVSLGANDLVREVLTMVDVDLRMQRVFVSTELREGLPQLLADRGQLQQVFLNLIMNAIEAMRSVTDRERSLRIRSDFIQQASGVLVTIEDSGIGIGRKDKDRIFEPFFTTKSSGTGIGLTICRSIIETHGGTLRASANKPYGTIFHVALPNR
jgi:signal transduction histidine kinase